MARHKSSMGLMMGAIVVAGVLYMSSKSATAATTGQNAGGQGQGGSPSGGSPAQTSPGGSPAQTSPANYTTYGQASNMLQNAAFTSPNITSPVFSA